MKKKWSIPFLVSKFDGYKGLNEHFEYLVFNFGKYKDQKAKDVVYKDPEYVAWCYDNLDKFYLQPHLRLEFYCGIASKIEYYLSKNNAARVEVFKDMAKNYLTDKEQESVINLVRTYNNGEFSDFVLYEESSE